MKYPDQLEDRDRAVGIILMVGGSVAVWLLILSYISLRLAR